VHDLHPGHVMPGFQARAGPENAKRRRAPCTIPPRRWCRRRSRRNWWCRTALWAVRAFASISSAAATTPNQSALLRAASSAHHSRRATAAAGQCAVVVMLPHRVLFRSCPEGNHRICYTWPERNRCWPGLGSGLCSAALLAERRGRYTQNRITRKLNKKQAVSVISLAQ
jgi:hypothetical protein